MRRTSKTEAVCHLLMKHLMDNGYAETPADAYEMSFIIHEGMALSMLEHEVFLPGAETFRTFLLN